MSKYIREDCFAISIFKLKEWGCFDYTYNCQDIIWTNECTGKQNKVGFSCHTEEQYFKLDYRIRGIGEDEWIKIEHSYPLVTTQCNYGGTRFWFECSVYTNGLYCGNRVAKLYLAPNGKYFACRHCYQLSYASRKEPRSGIAGSFVKVLTLEKRVDAMYKKLKIPYRKGQPTKRLQKIKELENMGFNIMANRV